jgi:ATP-binding cassette subfamily C protein CydC
LDQVGLWATFVSREGLDTQVGEDATWLSGGEAARIAFARAILAKKKLVILDEPTAALDHENSHKLISELLTASTINQTAILLITHDQEIANLCDAQVSF